MIIPREFYERDTLTVARELIGQVLVRKSPEGVTKGVIVEAEAYLGEIDPAAHSYKGKTRRVRVQYEGKGLAYVYMIYGVHYCMNITTGPAEKPEAILIRALEPIEGIDIMERRRGTSRLKNLCSGPGKLARAMDIDMNLYGTDLCSEGELYLEYSRPAEVEVSKRINVDYAGEAAHYLWRFTEKGSEYVSGKKKQEKAG
ncbi:MAG: DNA-3-methyladenine glycosylase [Oscillospiraceae bacterium]|nr:DNA-3-methyladenine glycosylase [Oscillospiraceae bacterium]